MTRNWVQSARQYTGEAKKSNQFCSPRILRFAYETCSHAASPLPAFDEAIPIQHSVNGARIAARSCNIMMREEALPRNDQAL
jgi:hypothetical protein